MKNFLTKFSIVVIIACLLSGGTGVEAKLWGKKPEPKPAANNIQKEKPKTETKTEDAEEKFSTAVPIPEGILSQSSFRISAIDPI